MRKRGDSRTSNSNWRSEILAVLRKEVRSEFRSKNGLLTSGLFGIVSVVTISLATSSTRLDPDVASGLYWVAMLFASVLALPRTFLVEEEQGTGDLLRLLARPHAVFWGKAVFNLALIELVGLVLSGCYVVLVDIAVPQPALFVVSVLGGCAALAGAVTLCGAIAARASNRYALATAVSMPMLFSILALGVSTMRSALGAGGGNGWGSAMGTVCYAIAVFAIGPWLFAAVWKS